MQIDDSGVYAPALSKFPGGSNTIGTPSVRTGLRGDVYLTLLDVPDADNGAVRLGLLVMPLAVWLWIGGGLMAVGTVLAAWPGRRRRPTDPVSAPIPERRVQTPPPPEETGRRTSGSGRRWLTRSTTPRDRRRDVRSKRTCPRRRVGLIIAIVLGLGMVALIAILATRPPALDRQGKSPLLGKPAPDIVGTTVTSTDGAEYKLSDRRGRFVLVNFFATWCAPVPAGAPRARVVQPSPPAGRRRRGRERRLQRRQQRRQEVLRGQRRASGRWCPTPRARTALSYGVTGIPESFLIDPNGFVVSKITGGVTSDGLDAIIDAAERAESGSRRMTRDRCSRTRGSATTLRGSSSSPCSSSRSSSARPAAAGPRTNTDRVNAIASEFKCPTCRSESVETSNAQTARIIRADIARRVEQGQTDDQIRAYLISRYGQDLLLTPASTGASSLVWILPVVALVCAIAGLAVAFRRWHASSQGEISDADRRLVDAAMKVERSHAEDSDGD